MHGTNRLSFGHKDKMIIIRKHFPSCKWRYGHHNHVNMSLYIMESAI